MLRLARSTDNNASPLAAALVLLKRRKLVGGHSLHDSRLPLKRLKKGSHRRIR